MWLRSTRSDRLWRGVVALCVLAALVTPVVRDADDFPLSTYPMYASARSTSTTFTLANGLTAEGDREALSLRLIGESDDPLVVSGELRAAVRRGAAAARCQSIAARVADQGAGGLRQIEVVSERHRTLDVVRGNTSLEERTVHAVCEVEPA